MAKEKVLVVGLGEIGHTLFELLRESERFEIYGFDVREEKMREIGQARSNLPSKVDIMHICIPFSGRDEFMNTVVDYLNQYKPKLVIIDSTVQPGTALDLHKRYGDCLIAHSPIRGVHKSLEHMKWELRRWKKYVGGVDAGSAEAARKHLETAGFNAKVLSSSLETELAKLFETTYRAWMIACFQEMHRISRSFGANFDEVVDFLEDTHRVRLDRPVMFPGVIYGHCLIPNTELLLEKYDSEFLHLILESNKKRIEEVKDKQIRSEIAKIKKRVEMLEKELQKIYGENV